MGQKLPTLSPLFASFSHIGCSQIIKKLFHSIVRVKLVLHSIQLLIRYFLPKIFPPRFQAVHGDECDQIGRFFKVLGLIFYQSSPNFWRFSEPF